MAFSVAHGPGATSTALGWPLCGNLKQDTREKVSDGGVRFGFVYEPPGARAVAFVGIARAPSQFGIWCIRKERR